jgi:hypothetical protein
LFAALFLVPLFITHKLSLPVHRYYVLVIMGRGGGKEAEGDMGI